MAPVRGLGAVVVRGAGGARVATSRTGTTKYLRNRAKVIREARAHGLTNCPGYQRRDGTQRDCGRVLDYDTPLTDASVEADHITDHRYGGSDDADNLRVLCRACNRERNTDRPAVDVAPVEDFPLSRAW